MDICPEQTYHVLFEGSLIRITFLNQVGYKELRIASLFMVSNPPVLYKDSCLKEDFDGLVGNGAYIASLEFYVFLLPFSSDIFESIYFLVVCGRHHAGETPNLQ